MIPKNVQMPNPNPKYKPPGTAGGGRGGTLMEIEKLIEALGDLEMCAYGYHINGEVLGMDCTDFECLMADAAEEVSKIPALQAENANLHDELEKVDAERDAVIKELNGVSSLVDDLAEFVDREIHPVVDYNLYLDLRENVDAVSMFQHEDEWRGLHKEE